MLSKTVEFLRIADLHPTDEKIRKRQESASGLLPDISGKESPVMLLDFLQGVIGGFESPQFSSDGPAVSHLVETIRANDATIPGDLSENAVELRALAAITVGELLGKQAAKPSDDAILAAMAIVSGLALRPATTSKHLRFVLETLFGASIKLLSTAAELRRQTSNTATLKLQALEKPAEEDVWTSIVPVIRSAINEVSSREKVDREEIEILWWMFSGFSETEQISLTELSPVAAGVCAGIELAQRSIVPPPPAAAALVKRSVEAGRKQQALAVVTLQDALTEWTPTMFERFIPAEGNAAQIAARYPSILPLSFACRSLRETSKLEKVVAAKTGVPLNRSLSPADWGAQVLREKLLHRQLGTL
jgi:hypothetical protein